jgi:hypothetical protein
VVKLSKGTSVLSTENLGELHMVIGNCLLKPTDVSLRVFSLVQLYTAIYLRRDLFDTGAEGIGREGVPPEPPANLIQQWFQRPILHRSSDSVKVHYDSAIPLAIAAKVAGSPQTIAAWMRDAVLEDTKTALKDALDPEAICVQVELRITDQGCLRWSWSPTTLAVWLDQVGSAIGQLPLLRVAAPPDPQSPQLWRSLHAYARCGDWLSQCSPIAAGPIDVGPIASEPTIDPLDWSILLKLIDVIDKLVESRLPPQTDSYLQAAMVAVQAFEDYDRHYLSPAIETAPPFRLGLVMLIKNLLYAILNQGLGLKTAEKI